MRLEPNKTNYLEGQNLSIRCNADGASGNARWSQPESSSLPEGVVQVGGNLTISHMTRQLAKQYTCTASNSHGTSNSSITLDMLSKTLYQSLYVCVI